MLAPLLAVVIVVTLTVIGLIIQEPKREEDYDQSRQQKQLDEIQRRAMQERERGRKMW